METIQLTEILAIYKLCGLKNQNANSIRYQINTGALSTPLNTGKIFVPPAEKMNFATVTKSNN